MKESERKKEKQMKRCINCNITHFKMKNENEKQKWKY